MNGLLIKSIIAADEWTCSYDAENRLTEIEYQDGSIIKFLYDGDGKRVARLNVDNEGTIYIGNYFESEYLYIEDTRPPLYLEPLIPVVSGLCEAETESCAYLPVLAREAELRPFPVKRGTSYYYADGQRIAMRSGSETYLLFGDHLASSILLVRGEGTVAEKAYYLPWGGTRGDETITSTAYAYTGQMREGDIYYYGARWYDADIGRFMQADTIVPLQVQGTQAFDRYAYVNNNPLRFTDPWGNWLCDATESGCWETSGESFDYGRLYSNVFNESLRYTIQGSYSFGIGTGTSIDRYQDDLVSPTVMSDHPVHVGLQLIDLFVRLVEEFRPQEMMRKTDHVFWSIYIEDNYNQLSIRNIFVHSFQETVVLRNIQVTEGSTGRGLFTFLPDGLANLKFGFETGNIGPFEISQISDYSHPYSIRINFGMRCYHCGGNYGVHFSGFEPYPSLPGSNVMFYQNWRNNESDR